MENIGQTLKSIRKSLSLTQTQISERIMSQSNYSKIEKGEIDCSFANMISILSRLDMSVEEFMYIHYQYKNNYNIEIDNLNKLKYNNIEQLNNMKTKLLKIEKPTLREEELIVISDALIIIAESNNYKVAKEKAKLVWNRLENHDDWYLYDIYLINNILYLFSVDTAISIVNLTMKKLKKYKTFRGINNLTASLYTNLLLLLIKDEQYEIGLKKVDELIIYCTDKNLVLYLAICYIRKGIILSNFNKECAKIWYEKGFHLLDITNNKDLKEEAIKEIINYSSE